MQGTDSFEKTLMLGKIEGRSRRGRQRMMVGWHHRLNGHEFEQAPRVGNGQGALVCCSPWGCKESDMTEQLSQATPQRILFHLAGLLFKVTSVQQGENYWTRQ